MLEFDLGSFNNPLSSYISTKVPKETFSYVIELLNYNYKVLTTINDIKQGIAKSFDNRYIIYNTGYKELQFSIPYQINGIENPLVDLIASDSFIKYSDSDGNTDIFIVKGHTDIHSESEFAIQYTCIVEFAVRLSKMKINTTIGGEDATALNVDGWADLILSQSGWTVASSSSLSETITYRDENGDLQTVTQEKKRILNYSNENIFNMLQNLATLFQVFLTFNNTNKTVTISETNPVVHNDVIIQYGKNTTNIQRHYDSDKLITKLYCYGGTSVSDGLVGISSVNPTLENYLLNFDYYKANGTWTDTHTALLDAFNASVTTANLDIKSALDSLTPLYETRIEYNSEIDTYSTLIDQYESEIATLVEQQKQYASGSADYTSIQEDINALTATMNDDQDFLDIVVASTAILSTDIAGFENTIATKEAEKVVLYTGFNSDFYSFISEGKFEDQSYMVPENLYADALDVSSRVAYPELSYTIDVLMLKGCIGHELETFNVGDTLLLNDEDLNISNVGITITKIECNLDNLLDSSIEISNNLSSFEDWYSKSTRTNQIISSRSDIFTRASEAFNGDGSMHYDTLEEALSNQTLPFMYLNTSKTVQVHPEGIYVYKAILVNGEITSDPNTVLRITSGGISTRTDTGWNPVIGVDGKINLNYAGISILDVNKVTIRNGEDAAFSWNKNGLLAYDYDENGIYSFSNYAKFYKNGLELYQNNNLRLVTGRMSDGYYGLAIYDDTGDVVVRTSNQGDFWLQKYMSVGGSDPAANLAGISGTGSLATSIRFWAGIDYANMSDAPFRVQDDGSLFAYNAYLSGEIHASTGSIDQYLYVGDTPHRIIIDSGLDETGVYTRTCKIYTNHWALNSDGSAQFSNITASGIIQCAVFNYDKTSVTSGSMMIMNATALTDDLIITSLVTSAEIILDGADTLLYSMFKVDDILSIDMIDTTTNLTVRYWFQVTSAKAIDGTGNIEVLPIIITSLDQLPTDGVFPAGSILLNWGQASTSTGIRMVGASATENAPFIDMFSATQNEDLSYTIGVTPSLRIGKLDGITDSDFVDMNGNPMVIDGYGLYADKVFLKGTIVAENAVIVNSSISGSVIAGSIDAQNVYIRDRSVSGSSSPDGWYFVIYPDNDETNEADKTKFRWLSYENGIHIRNYNHYFYHTDSLDTDETLATGAIFPSDDLCLFTNIGNYYVSSTDYISGILSENALQFRMKTYAGVPNILNYNLDDVPLFEVGIISESDTWYGFIGAQENTSILFGTQVYADGLWQIDTTKSVKIGVNTTSLLSDFNVNQGISVGDGYYFSDNGSNFAKIVKHADGSGGFDLDFYGLV